MIRVMIVDDHPIVRQGVRAELAKTPDIRVIEEARNADEAMTKVRTCKPDLVLLDISLPGKNGYEVLRQMHAELPDTRVLVLSTYSEKQYAVRCLGSGARGYLTKDSAPEELVIAIRRVSQGRKYVSAEIAQLLAEDVGAASDRLPHEELTDREFQVLCLFGQGKTVSQIADVLSLSLSTINTHRSHILEKMRMETTAQLIRYAVDHGLADQ
ncbi:MAG TPA: response regulator transcription factor [Bacteroidota bacterium]|nr:response regulator transcription factor [Bacteroidota bacterium]